MRLRENARREASISFAIFINIWRQKLQHYLPQSTIHKYFHERSNLPDPLVLKGVIPGDEGDVELSESQRNWSNESINFSRLRTRSEEDYDGNVVWFTMSYCFHLPY